MKVVHYSNTFSLPTASVGIVMYYVFGCTLISASCPLGDPHIYYYVAPILSFACAFSTTSYNVYSCVGPPTLCIIEVLCDESKKGRCDSATAERGYTRLVLGQNRVTNFTGERKAQESSYDSPPTAFCRNNNYFQPYSDPQRHKIKDSMTEGDAICGELPNEVLEMPKMVQRKKGGRAAFPIGSGF